MSVQDADEELLALVTAAGLMYALNNYEEFARVVDGPPAAGLPSASDERAAVLHTALLACYLRAVKTIQDLAAEAR